MTTQIASIPDCLTLQRLHGANLYAAGRDDRVYRTRAIRESDVWQIEWRMFALRQVPGTRRGWLRYRPRAPRMAHDQPLLARTRPAFQSHVREPSHAGTQPQVTLEAAEMGVVEQRSLSQRITTDGAAARCLLRATDVQAPSVFPKGLATSPIDPGRRGELFRWLSCSTMHVS